MKKLLFIILLACIKQINAQVCFSPANNYNVNTAPYGMCTADFNGDGHPDLATANNTTNDVTILLGTGTGTFGGGVNYLIFTNAKPYGICTGDFNGDGHPDLATANTGAANVSVLLGNGAGGFGGATNFTTAGFASDITTDDFNGDGKADLAASVANGSSGYLSVLLGTGTGSFGGASSFGVTTVPYDICTADFNGDGKKDVVIVGNSSSVSVLLGTGTGSFGATSTFSSGASTNPFGVCCADFNGDGFKDIATSNRNGNSASLLLGNGAGSFGTASQFGTGTNSSPYGICTADFNGDGKADLATANNGSYNASVLLGNGAGSFGSYISFGANSFPWPIATADFNGDGKSDLAVANYNSDDVSVLLNVPPTPVTPGVIGGTVTQCSDLANQIYSISTVTNATTYTWAMPAGWSITAGQGTNTVTVSTGAGGDNGNVTVTAGNSCGTSPASTLAVTVVATPTITGNTPQTRCGIGTLTLSATASSGTINWYDASTGGNLLGTGANFVTPTVSVTTIYYIDATSGSCTTPVRTAVTASVNTLPPVTANANANTFCLGSGGGIVLSGGGANTYTWTGGITDGVAFTPSTTQTYTVTGTDGNGCKNTAIKTVTVSNPPTVYANASTTTLCKGDTLTLFGSGAATYTWTGGAVDNVPFVINASNTYYVSGTDVNGCTNTNSASIAIAVNAPPSVTVSGVSAICSGSSVTLTALGAISSYLWSTGATTNTISVAPSSITTYSVTGYGSNGCGKTVSKTITVNPTPTISAVASPTLVCAGAPAILSVSGNASTYTWSTNATTTTITVTPSVTTTYSVSGTGANSCTTTTSVVLYAPDNLAPEICMVTTDSITNYQYNIIYWQNTLYPTADSFIVYRYNGVSANYLVIGIVPADSTRFIDVNRNIGGPNGGNPNVGGWQYTLAVKDLCGNISPKSYYHFTANFQQNNQNLIWSPYQVQSPQVNPLNGYQVLRDSMGIGDYHVFANVSYLTTSTQDPSYASYPNAQYRVDALGFNCVANERLAGGNNSTYGIRQKSHSNTSRQAGVGIKQLASGNQQISIYPNPTKNNFTIEPNVSEKQMIQMFDVNGKLVLSQTINGKTNIDVSSLNDGVYNVNVISNEGVVNKRLVIVR